MVSSTPKPRSSFWYSPAGSSLSFSISCPKTSRRPRTSVRVSPRSVSDTGSESAMPNATRASRSSTSGPGSARSSDHSPSSPRDVALIPCTTSPVALFRAAVYTRLGTINGWSSPISLTAFCAAETTAHRLVTKGASMPSCTDRREPPKAAFAQHASATIGVPLGSACTLGRRFR